MIRRPALTACLIVLGLVSLARSGAAQTKARPTRLGVSASVGLFVPRDATMSDVYGRSLVPMTGQVDVPIWRLLSVFGGLRWLPASGESVPVVGPATRGRFSASLGVRTFRVGLLASRRVAPRWTLGGGGGVGTSRYHEAMQELDLKTSGRATGLFGLAEARYAIRARWSVIGRFEYSSIPVATMNRESLDIGGPDFQVGLRFAF